MRKAISFSGQSRFVLEGLESFRKNLHNFEEYDIFIHTWKGPLNKDCFLYDPQGIIIEEQKPVIPASVKEYTDLVFVHFSMFYSMKESLRLLSEYEQANNFKYDLVILGDILEHMSESDAVNLWSKISKEAKYAMISIPIVHYHQGAINENPYEVHVEEDWTVERVLEKFSHIVEHKKFEVTGTFIAEFNNGNS